MKLKIKDISKAAEKNKPIGKNLRRRCCLVKQIPDLCDISISLRFFPNNFQITNLKLLLKGSNATTQKMKFSIKDFFW